MNPLNPRNTIIAILATLSASLALADDFKTINGKEYKDATVSRIEPDGIVVKTKSGLSKLYFTELPNEVQRRFNYDTQQGAAFSAAEAANVAAQNQEQKQHDEMQHQQQATASQKLAKVGEVQATVNAIWGLEGRLTQIQSEKGTVKQKIHEMRRWKHVGRLEWADLHDLEERLRALESKKRKSKTS